MYDGKLELNVTALILYLQIEIICDCKHLLVFRDELT